MKEVWKPVFNGVYRVSNMGRVERVKSLRNLARHGVVGSAYNNGYIYLTPCIRGRHLPATAIHRLVLRAFVGPCPKGKQVNHLNGDKRDNRLCNLEYVTRSQNALHAVAIGLAPIGSRHYKAKLTEADVLEIRRVYKFRDGVKLAARYGVSPSMIHLIVHNRNWKHI